jgi:hypothetical protein
MHIDMFLWLVAVQIFSLRDVLESGTVHHYPRLEIVSPSKLSSVSYNSYIKPFLLSADYDGRISLIDSTSGVVVRQFEREHSKRVWSVDFSQVNPWLPLSLSPSPPSLSLCVCVCVCRRAYVHECVCV